MPFSLTLSDNLDGTGVTATVTGGDPGETWEFFLLGADQPGGSGAYTSYGTRVGPGTKILAITGRVVGYAVGTVSGATPYQFGQATDQAGRATATAWRATVKATIEAIGLPLAGGVEEQWMPDETNLEFPCVILTVEGVRETNEDGMNLTDDIGYPVRVMICDKQDMYDHDSLPDYELWRQLIADQFRERQFATPRSHVITHVEWDNVIDPNVSKFMFMVSQFVVRGVCREPRGVRT